MRFSGGRKRNITEARGFRGFLGNRRTTAMGFRPFPQNGFPSRVGRVSSCRRCPLRRVIQPSASCPSENPDSPPTRQRKHPASRGLALAGRPPGGRLLLRFPCPRGPRRRASEHVMFKAHRLFVEGAVWIQGPDDRSGITSPNGCGSGNCRKINPV